MPWWYKYTLYALTNAVVDEDDMNELKEMSVEDREKCLRKAPGAKKKIQYAGGESVFNIFAVRKKENTPPMKKMRIE